MPRLKGWIAAVAADPAAMLFVAAVVLFIVILVGMALAARRRRRDDHGERVGLAPEAPAQVVAIAPWVEEGRQLFSLWQERVERLGELQGRLAAMAQEIEQLKAQAGAQAGRIDELRAENLRLGQEAEAFSMERDQLRAVLARIGELVRQATEARPSVAGEATPGAGP